MPSTVIIELTVVRNGETLPPLVTTIGLPGTLSADDTVQARVQAVTGLREG